MIQGEKLLCSLYYTNNSQSRCFEKSSHTLYLMERCWVKGPQKKTCIVATPLRHKGWWIFLYNHFHLMNACNVHIDIIPIKHTSWYHIQHVFRYYQQFLHLVVQNWWKLCTLGSCIEFGSSKIVSGIDVTAVIECMLFIIKKKELKYIEMFRN